MLMMGVAARRVVNGADDDQGSEALPARQNQQHRPLLTLLAIFCASTVVLAAVGVGAVGNDQCHL